MGGFLRRASLSLFLKEVMVAQSRNELGDTMKEDMNEQEFVGGTMVRRKVC
jgi:hypothetical protein